MNLSELPYSPVLARVLLVAATVLGTSSLLMWLAFVFYGGFNIVRFDGLSETGILVLDGCLSMVFFLQHSIMARSFFRKLLSCRLHDDLHGAVFTISTAIALLAAIVLWQKSENTLIPIAGVYRYAMHSIFVLGFAGFHWGVKSLGTFDIYGVNPIQRRLRSEPEPPPIPFTIRGPYCFVRHPLYLATLLMIWSCPNFTADRLLHNIMWSAWIAIGTVLEERDLGTAFGGDYVKYQKEVPMLIPWKIGLLKRSIQ